MSILLRSALLYNCQRRLGQLDSLKTILAEKAIVVDDDSQDADPAENGKSVQDKDLTASPQRLFDEGNQYKQRVADKTASPEPGFPAEKSNAAWKYDMARETNRYAPNVIIDSPDGGDGREVDNSSSRSGIECSLIGDTNDDVDSRSPEMRENNTSKYRGARGENKKSNRSTGLDARGCSSSNHSHIPATARTPVSTRTDAISSGNIHRCHLDRVLAIDVVLHRITQAIFASLMRFNNEQAQRSSLLIAHFWLEAARLKGSVPVQSPRMQQKAFFAADWGAGEEIDNPNDNGIGTPGKNERRRCKSPLVMSFRPDDLIWEDQLSSWQLGIGRARDEEGRRCLKL